MADLSINSQISNSLNSSVNTRGIEPQKTADAKSIDTQNRNTDENRQAIGKDAASKAEDVRTSEYGPIIAKSGDGDTVRVKNEKSDLRADDKENSAAIYDVNKAVNDRREKEVVPNIDLPEKKQEQKAVEAKQEEPKVAEAPKREVKAEEAPKQEQQRSQIDLNDKSDREKLAKKAAESAKRQTIEETNPGLVDRKNQEKIAQAGSSAYSGYTDAQLEQMYLRGDVSQIEYNQEVEARDAAREARLESAKENTREIIEDEAESREIERTAETINTIQTGEVLEGEGTVPIEARLQAIQNLDNMVASG
jgi:endonuclease YncB( thermonuclease family)